MLDKFPAERRGEMVRGLHGSLYDCVTIPRTVMTRVTGNVV